VNLTHSEVELLSEAPSSITLTKKSTQLLNEHTYWIRQLSRIACSYFIQTCMYVLPCGMQRVVWAPANNDMMCVQCAGARSCRRLAAFHIDSIITVQFQSSHICMLTISTALTTLLTCIVAGPGKSTFKEHRKSVFVLCCKVTVEEAHFAAPKPSRSAGSQTPLNMCQCAASSAAVTLQGHTAYFHASAFSFSERQMTSTS